MVLQIEYRSEDKHHCCVSLLVLLCIRLHFMTALGSLSQLASDKAKLNEDLKRRNLVLCQTCCSNSNIAAVSLTVFVCRATYKVLLNLGNMWSGS